MIKKFLIPMLILGQVSFNVSDTILTKAERKMATAEMKSSSKHLLAAIKGLSTAQLNYKSSPVSWSVAECTEHIALSESMIFGMLLGTLKTAPDPSRRNEVKISDEQLLIMITDRSNKLKTGELLEPAQKFGSHEASVKEFLTRRKEHIAFVKKTPDDLRNRYLQLPFGTIDAFQVLLFMGAHTDRHVKQIEEIKAGEGFPVN